MNWTVFVSHHCYAICLTLSDRPVLLFSEVTVVASGSNTCYKQHGLLCVLLSTVTSGSKR